MLLSDRWILGISLVLALYFGTLLILSPESRPSRAERRERAQRVSTEAAPLVMPVSRSR